MPFQVATKLGVWIEKARCLTGKYLKLHQISKLLILQNWTRTTSADHLTSDHLTEAQITSDIVDNIGQYSFVNLPVQYWKFQSCNQKQMSAAMSMSVKYHSEHRVCAYKSDDNNCDNVFWYSENSSNTDSSDNDQLSNLNLLSRLGISTFYGFLFVSKS